MTFISIFFVELSKFRSFCTFTVSSRVKSSSSCQSVFSIMRIYSHICLEGIQCVFSSVSSPFTHLWCIQVLELLKVSFFTTFRIDDRLIPIFSTIFLLDKCVWDRSSEEQTNSSYKSMLFSVEKVTCSPEPWILFIEPVSLNDFNGCLTGE